MTDAPDGHWWIFHTGALGDSVLVWPLLRALARAGRTAHFVTQSSKARLAAACVLPATITGRAPPGAIVPHDAEHGLFVRLWRGPAAIGESEAVAGAAAVVSFFTERATDPGRAWLSAAAKLFPGAEVVTAGPVGSTGRRALWERARVDELGGAAPAGVVASGDAPAVLHAGAGGEAKRWPVDRWLALAAALRAQRPGGAELLAGEVESERFTAGERAAFERAGGRFCDNLLELGAEIRRSGLYIGADTGPTHLAAQLGVPTLALFGPTDPSIWSPVGPSVRVLAPPSPTADMSWLGVEAVESAADQMPCQCR